MALYAVGLLIFLSDPKSTSDESTTNKSRNDGSRFAFFLNDEEVLQQVPIYLDSMKEFFDIGGNGNVLSEKVTLYLFSYYNALNFLCQPLADCILKERKELFAERNGAIFITNLGIIHNVFHQFCYVFRQFHGYVPCCKFLVVVLQE